MDIVFKGTPYGDITILDSWPQWQKNMWLAVLGAPQPQPQPFSPTFEEQHFSQEGNEPPMPLNPDYYATSETAIALMQRFNAARVARVPSFDSVPPASQTWLVWSDGIAVCAGLLAKQFVLNHDHPSIADANCENLIANQRAAGTHLPTNS